MKGKFKSWLYRVECLEGNEDTARELRAMLPGMLVEQVAAVFLELVNVFVSGFFSTAAMAGVGQINTVNSVLMNLFQAFAIGGTAIVSRHAGAARRKDAAESAFSALLLGVTVSIALTILIFALRGEFVLLLFGDAEADVIASSNIYFGFTALAPPLWFVYFQCCGFMRAAGDTKRPMYVSVALNASSLVLNLVLTFTLDLGITGTALSYLLSVAIAAAASLAMVLRRGFELRPSRCGAAAVSSNVRAHCLDIHTKQRREPDVQRQPHSAPELSCRHGCRHDIREQRFQQRQRHIQRTGHGALLPDDPDSRPLRR